MCSELKSIFSLTEIAKIEKLILKDTLTMSKITLSYMECLIPELKSCAIIMLREKSFPFQISPSEASKQIEANDGQNNLETTEMDITGSPLKCTFENDSFNDTMIPCKRNWTKEEECYVPLTRSEACVTVNLCLEYLGKDWVVPIFAICDGKDSEHTVLIGTHVRKEWFTTTHVRTLDQIELSKIKGILSTLMQEHLALSFVQEHEVDVSVFSVYELFGTKQRMIDWKEVPESTFEGSIDIEANWNTLSFYPPLRMSTYNLIIEVGAGWKGSPLIELWEQLLLLHRYVTMLEMYQTKNKSSRYTVMPLYYPDDFISPNFKSREETTERLNLLLSGENTFGECWYDNYKKKPLTSEENDMKLWYHLEELRLKQNQDFINLSWQMLTASTDYEQVTDSIHVMFEEASETGCELQIGSTNSTRIEKILSELMQQKMTVPSLAGSLPLELLIDVGLEKLSRDYTYLLLSANLIELHQLQQKLENVSSGIFEVKSYRKKLTSLAQIHICLEFLLLAQVHLDCPVVYLQSMFERAFQQYSYDESPVKSVSHLLENRIYHLRTSLPNSIAERITKGSPATWRLTLSSQSRITKLTTVTHCSHLPIFPPNIHYTDETNEEEEIYYYTKVISSSNRIMKCTNV